MLFGLGFVGFGVGGGFGGGGVLEGCSATTKASSSSSYTKQVSEVRRSALASIRHEAAAWENARRRSLHEASGEANTTTKHRQQFTSKGKELLTKVAAAWGRYLALNPRKPNAERRAAMLRVYGEEGLNQPAAAVQVMQLVIAAKPPSAALYAQLARVRLQGEKHAAWATSRRRRRSELAPAASTACRRIEV